ncbi:unnamed protein product [Allacma fusca]|uniref:Uncharacterized protein n=1 Tax=Allacma fusca TaxID=39272 RepID=A0A8J2NVF5_9HEXA|nr:unnamed protein product [Allacma fusca]
MPDEPEAKDSSSSRVFIRGAGTCSGSILKTYSMLSWIYSLWLNYASWCNPAPIPPSDAFTVLTMYEPGVMERFNFELLFDPVDFNHAFTEDESDYAFFDAVEQL